MVERILTVKGKGGMAPAWKRLGNLWLCCQLSSKAVLATGKHLSTSDILKVWLLLPRSQTPRLLVPTFAIQSRTSRGQAHFTLHPSQVVWSGSNISAPVTLYP